MHADLITPLVAHDSDAGLRATVPDVLNDAALLAGLDLAPDRHATFLLAAADGTTRELAVTACKTGARAAPPRELPVHLQGPPLTYWSKYVAEDRLLLLAYNACADGPRAGTLGFVDQHPVDRFVIDLRRNEGGDSRLLQPLLTGLSGSGDPPPLRSSRRDLSPRCDRNRSPRTVWYAFHIASPVDLRRRVRVSAVVAASVQ